jgi:hypothetical protein
MFPRIVGRLSRGFGTFRYHLLLPAAFLAIIATVMMHSVAAQSPFDCVRWTASTDRRPAPGAVSTLHVQGDCTFRFAGYNAELRPHLPLSTDSNVFLLDVIVHPPAGPAVPGRGGVEDLSYSTRVGSSYQTVLLLPDHIAVPVRQGF